MTSSKHTGWRAPRRCVAHETCLTSDRAPRFRQVFEFIRRSARALRFPQRLAKRLHQHVLSLVTLVACGLQRVMQFTDAGRSVDRQLFAYGEVQSHM